MSFYKEVPGRQTTLESTLKFDTTPTAGSTNPVTSDGVNTAITDAVGGASDALQEQIDDIAEKAGSGYIPKGEADAATLNTLSGQENGWLYTMTDSGTLTDGSLAVVAGDTVAWDATNSVWYKAMDYAPRQYGTNEVHNLPTTITSFRTGDVIPVDGPSGTAKMSKDDLLKETAKNAVDSGVAAPNNVGYVTNTQKKCTSYKNLFFVGQNLRSGHSYRFTVASKTPISASSVFLSVISIDEQTSYISKNLGAWDGSSYTFDYKAASDIEVQMNLFVADAGVGLFDLVATVEDVSDLQKFDSIDNRMPQAFNVFGLDYTEQTEASTADNKLLNNLGLEETYSGWATKTYNVSNYNEGNGRLAISCYLDDLGSSFSWVVFYKDSTMLKRLLPKYSAGEIYELDVPAGTNKIKVSYKKSIGESKLYKFRGHSANSLVNTLSCNFLNKKNVVWFGTSIPAGGDYNVSNPNSYPVRFGKLVGAHVNNEAVGSSCAKAISHTATSSFEYVAKHMGHTLSEKISIINDTWTIDDENQTFTNGPRTYWHLDNIPSVSTYEQVCAQRAKVLSYSYEVKLVLKYLIKDDTQRSAFLSSRIDDDLLTILTTEGLVDFSYQGDYDLFVFDHGHNDYINTADEGYTIVNDYKDIPDNSTVMTNFIGAMNKFISMIYRYKPKARVVIVSDYDDFAPGDKTPHAHRITCEVQQRVANHWHIPFIDVRSQIPYSAQTKVLTQGWWNPNTSRWSDTGFTWSDDDGTNAYICSYIGQWATPQELKELINPVQVDGVWFYEYCPRYIWLKDGLHPHSDASWTAIDAYARILVGLFKSIEV